MSLDPRTMLIMIAALSLMLSGLLALAGLHAGNVRGGRQWALANLCISIGLGFSVLQLTPANAGGWVMGGSILFAAGSGLQFVGIQAFMEKACDWRIPVIVVSAVFAQAAWFTLIRPDVIARSVANDLIFAAINAASASMLLIRVRPPLRTACWLTGLSFAALSLTFFLRALVLAFSPSPHYTLYAHLSVNSAALFMGSVIQLCLSFGFVLMLNYRLADELQHLAARDFLTGAFNRRSFESEAERLLKACSRRGGKLTVMMIDVDRFKEVNDRYGHAAGDEVLRRLTVVAQGELRSGDYFARYGGEEFCVLLDSMTKEQAWMLAERLREIYAAMPVRFGEDAIYSTISIGMADSIPGTTLASLQARADEALYRAKQKGRNRVEVFSDH